MENTTFLFGGESDGIFIDGFNSFTPEFYPATFEDFKNTAAYLLSEYGFDAADGITVPINSSKYVQTFQLPDDTTLMHYFNALKP